MKGRNCPHPCGKEQTRCHLSGSESGAFRQNEPPCEFDVCSRYRGAVWLILYSVSGFWGTKKSILPTLHRPLPHMRVSPFHGARLLCRQCHSLVLGGLLPLSCLQCALCPHLTRAHTHTRMKSLNMVTLRASLKNTFVLETAWAGSKMEGSLGIWSQEASSPKTSLCYSWRFFLCWFDTRSTS